MTSIDYHGVMKTMTVAEFKAKFSEVLEYIQKGEEVAVSYGKSHRPIGLFVPYAEHTKRRKLGLLGKGKFKLRADFKMTEEELIE